MKKPRFTTRTRARKRALDILYEADQRGYGTNPDKILRLMDKRRELRAAQSELPEYAAHLVRGVCANLAQIDELIGAHTTSWPIERMPPVDLGLARIAIYEMLFDEETEDEVAIEQAANIAAIISTDKSPDFLNGLLNKIMRIQDTVHIDIVAPTPDAQAHESSDSKVSDSLEQAEVYDDELDDIWLADLPDDYDFEDE